MPTELDEHPRRTSKRRVQRYSHNSESNQFETAESILCGSMGVFLAVVMIMLLMMAALDPKHVTLGYGRVVYLSALAVAIIFDGWLIVNIVRCISERRFPLAPKLGLMHPSLPAFARPLVALVWSIHAVLLIVAALHMHRRLGDTDAIIGAFPFLLVMAYLGNTYVVLAASAITKGSVFARRFWRWRFAVDVAIAVAVPALNWLRRI